jgi:hypothetical protein
MLVICQSDQCRVSCQAGDYVHTPVGCMCMGEGGGWKVVVALGSAMLDDIGSVTCTFSSTHLAL